MWEKTIIVFSIVISLFLISISLSVNKDELSGSNAVREENGIQYIQILARGGYSPRNITAKANIQTVLEVETKGTYDCSASLSIPQLGYQKFLPATGITKIEIPKDLAINSLDILCSMGMYRSTINFGS